MPDGFEHPSHLPVAAFVEREIDDRMLARRRDDPQSRRRSTSFLELDAALNASRRLRLEASAQRRAVQLFDAEARMRQRVREIAVVRQQQDARRVVVEPSDRNEARRTRASAFPQKIGDGAPPLRIAHRRDNARGFVEHDDFARALAGDETAVELDAVALGDLRPQLANDPSIDLDATGDDQRFRRASRCDAGAGQIALQSYGESPRTPLRNRLPRA